MIFFCEDCGTKNSLTDECIVEGLVTFRCKSCHYLNSYPLPGTTRASALDKAGSAANSREKKQTDSSVKEGYSEEQG